MRLKARNAETYIIEVFRTKRAIVGYNLMKFMAFPKTNRSNCPGCLVFPTLHTISMTGWHLLVMKSVHGQFTVLSSHHTNLFAAGQGSKSNVAAVAMWEQELEIGRIAPGSS